MTEKSCFGKNLSSLLKLKISHSELHSGTDWLHLLLRHHYFLHDTSSLLQAKERNVR